MNNYSTIFNWFILFFFAALSLQAQTNLSANGASTNVVGKVSKVDENSNQITIKTADGVMVTATIEKPSEIKQVPAGETNVKNAVTITLGQVAVGDNAIIRGKYVTETAFRAQQVLIVSQTDISSRQTRKRDDWAKRGIVGTVKKVDPQAQRITVELRGENSPLIDIIPTATTVFQHYENNAVNLNDFKPGNLGAIKEGDQIRALGNKSADGAQMAAEEIFSGSFRTVFGKITSVNAGSNEFVIKNLQSAEEIKVILNSSSNLRRLTAELVKNELTAGDGGVKEKSTPKSINLTEILKRSPQISIENLKSGETVIVAFFNEPKAAEVVGITVISGGEILSPQPGNKTPSAKRFDLDVF